MNVVETRELSLVYDKRTVLDSLTLLVPAGSIYGLVGPDRAGKTFALRILATLQRPTSGDATIMGKSVIANPENIRRVVGYMPASFGVYGDMTVAEYLRFFAACYGIPASEHNSLVTDLLQLVDLLHRRDVPVDHLPPGMRQRLSLARALAHDPQVLLLDEPWANLDPRARVEMRELIKELRNMNKTVIVTSQTFVDLNDICTHMSLMDRGHLVLSGTTTILRTQMRSDRVISVKFFGNTQQALNIAHSGKGVLEARLVLDEEKDHEVNKDTSLDLTATSITIIKELRIIFNGSYADATALLRLFMRSGVQVVSFGEYIGSISEFLLAPTVTNHPT